MKKRLFKRKTREHSFWRRKTTTRIVMFAVVFILLSPFLLVPNTAHALSLDFGALASGALDSAFKGATDYAAGSVFGYVTGKLGPGFSSLVDQRQRWQGLYEPAMKKFMTAVDKSWMPSVPGMFTTLVFQPESALGFFVGEAEKQAVSQNEAEEYTALVRNAQGVITYQQNQGAAQETYQEAQQDIEKATESEGINLLGPDSQIAKDITASQALDSAAAAVVVGGGGGGGGGTLETIESVARIASTVATVISLVI